LWQITQRHLYGLFFDHSIEILFEIIHKELLTVEPHQFHDILLLNFCDVCLTSFLVWILCYNVILLKQITIKVCFTSFFILESINSYKNFRIKFFYDIFIILSTLILKVYLWTLLKRKIFFLKFIINIEKISRQVCFNYFLIKLRNILLLSATG